MQLLWRGCGLDWKNSTWATAMYIHCQAYYPNDEGYTQSPKKSCSVGDENGSYSQLLDMMVITVAVNCWRWHTSLSCCHLQYKQDKCAADNSSALWWINLSQSFCLQFDPRSFLKREQSSEIFSSNQSNTRLQWTMWIQIHRGGFLWAWRRRRRRSMDG